MSPAWSTEGTKRLTALTFVTFGLLVLRLHVMGSKLPVFTRYFNDVNVQIRFQSLIPSVVCSIAVIAWCSFQIWQSCSCGSDPGEAANFELPRRREPGTALSTHWFVLRLQYGDDSSARDFHRCAESQHFVDLRDSNWITRHSCADAQSTNVGHPHYGNPSSLEVHEIKPGIWGIWLG